MKYYLITNVGTLKGSKYAQEYPFHLVLAQVLVQDSDYYKLVKQLINDGRQVILDNGAHERVRCSLSEYADMVLDLQPWCAVLPDLLGVSAVESRARAAIFYNLLIKKSSPNCPKHPITLMYVPQGRNTQEIVDDYIWFYACFWQHPIYPSMVGLGDAYKQCIGEVPTDSYEQAERVKTRLLRKMLSESIEHPKMHVLGGRTNSTDFYAGTPSIIGIDSVDPCRQALRKTVYGQCYDPPFEPFGFLTDIIADEKLLKTNIQAFCNKYGAVTQ